MNESKEKIIDKIKKLLRLGQRTNHAGERDAALAKAAEIAASAGLDISGIDAGDSGPARMTRETMAFSRRTHARSCVHDILRKHFGVFVVGGCGNGRKRFRLSARKQEFMRALWPSRGLTFGEAVSVCRVARGIQRTGRYEVDCGTFVIVAEQGSRPTE